MSGGGIGGAAGTALGVALAPETGGLSMAIPALAGAIGAGVGGAATGSKNPLMDALMGGIGGGLTGGISGGFDAANMFGDAAGASGAGGAASGVMGDAGQMGYVGDMPSTIGSDAASAPSISTAVGADASGIPASIGSGSPVLSGVGNYLSKQNPLALALAGSTGLSAIDSLLPKPKVNIGQNAANVMATNPSFNATLPKYNLQNNGTPYAGNWYTYGQQAQTPMYSGQLIPQNAKHGGLMGYAHGGRVKGYAAGGMPMMPQGAPPAMPPQGAPSTPIPPQGNPLAQGMAPRPAMPPQTQPPVNPLMLAAAHKIGMVIGKHIRNGVRTPPGQVKGQGGGQDDAIPARLSQDEFVMPADVVAHLGDGSSNAGAKKLTGLMHQVRAEKTAKGASFPPKAKNPLAYLKGA